MCTVERRGPSLMNAAAAGEMMTDNDIELNNGSTQQLNSSSTGQDGQLAQQHCSVDDDR